jgi:hypothetical protein
MNTWIHVVVLPIIQCHRQDLQSDDGWRDSAVELVFSCAQLGVEAGRRTGRRVTDGDPPMKTWKKRWKTWNIAISKGTTRETWWNMMKHDERWWKMMMPFFSVGIKSLPFPDKARSKRQKGDETCQKTPLQRINVEEVNCFLQIWRLTKPTMYTHVHQLKVALQVHWTGGFVLQQHQVSPLNRFKCWRHSDLFYWAKTCLISVR